VTAAQPETTSRPQGPPQGSASSPVAAVGPNPAHWLGYSAFAGWLGGPLLAATYWLARGNGEQAQASFNRSSADLPAAGFTLVLALYIWMTRSALAVSWRSAASRACAVLLVGSTGWVAIQFVRFPTGSISQLTFAWLTLTAPYPATAALIHLRATRASLVVAEPVLVPAPAVAAAYSYLGFAGRLARHRPRTIAAAFVAAAILGLAAESNTPAVAHTAKPSHSSQHRASAVAPAVAAAHGRP